MHLEDRLQELYFKSKMLSEYLRGQMRVHVKELGVVLGYVHGFLSGFAFTSHCLSARDIPQKCILSFSVSLPVRSWILLALGCSIP